MNFFLDSLFQGAKSSYGFFLESVFFREQNLHMDFFLDSVFFREENLLISGFFFRELELSCSQGLWHGVYN
jgi:hypothetical protein